MENVTNLAKGISNAGAAAKDAGGNAASGSVGFDGLKDKMGSTGSGANKLAQELHGTETAAKDAGGNAASSSVGFDGLKDKIGGAGSGAKELDGIVGGSLNPTFSLLKNNLGSLVGAFTALALAYGLKESADYAARTEVLGTTLAVVAKNAGYSTTEMAAYEKEVKGLGITTQATRQALTQMIQAGLEIGPAAAGQVSQVAQLARAAQDLAVVTGENSSATLTRLITNIQQMDTEGLRYMGLTVNIQQAQDKFALSLGKTSEQLSQQQKIQAVANAALDQAATLTGAYEASMQNVGKQLQSIKRYQEELANDIGNKLLPAYYQLVVAATDFLKAADDIVRGMDKSGNSAKTLAEGVKTFFVGLKDLGLAVVQIVAEITPAFVELISQVLSFSGDVLAGIAGILGFGTSIDEAGQKTSVFGQILRVIIETFAFLVAGFRDGLDFINMGIAELGGEFQILVGTMVKGWGMLLGYIAKDTGAAIEKAGDAMIAAGVNMRAFAADTAKNFEEGNTHVGRLNASLEQTKELSAALAKATSFSDVEEQIRKLAEAKRLHHLTDVELTKSADEVTNAIKHMGTEVDATTGKTKLSEEQVKKLDAALLNITKTSAQQFADLVNDMGLKLAKFGGTDYLTPLSKEFEKLAGDVMKLAENATASSLEFRQSFSKGLDSAKTLADIDKIADSLKEATKAGKDVGDAATEINGKFEQLFTTALKAAKTKDDLALLTAELKQMGEKGEVSGKLIAKAMADIEERTKGARAETALLAQQATELSKSMVSLAQAHLSVARADYDVGHARLDVWKAQNKYARDGTDLSREELRLAELNLKLAQAKAAEARLAYAEAQQSNRVLIAQQEQILATKRLERDLDNEALILAKDAATKALEGAQAVYEVTKQKAEKQQEIVLKTEEEVLQQKFLVDQAKAAEEETKKIKDNMEASASATSKAADSMKNLATASSQVQSIPSASPGPAPSNRPSQGNSKNGDMSFGSTVETLESLTKKLKDAGLDAQSARAKAEYLVGKQLYVDIDAEISKAGDAAKGKAVGNEAGINTGKGGTGGWGVPGGGLGGWAGPGITAESLLQQVTPQQTPLPTPHVSTLPDPSKMIMVTFNDSNGKAIPLTVEASNEQALLDMLKRAKGVFA